MQAAITSTTTAPHFHADPVVRTHLDFDIEKMNRYWFRQDPFLTRYFDAFSMAFPEGERYFIESVRALKNNVTDEKLLQSIADFTKQEAQHTLAHKKMNAVIAKSGIDVNQFTQADHAMFMNLLKNRSDHFNIAITAASEHLTALMAECFFGEKWVMQNTDPHARALFAWHAIEEMEHRDVAFDVMRHSEVSELLRYFALLQASLMVFGRSYVRANAMLKQDGYGLAERSKMMVKGTKFLFGGKHGVISRMYRQYFDWFKPNFHPSQHPIIQQYDVWVDTLESTNDPIAAGEAFWQAARG